jgi:hypothetical protein
MPIFYTQPDLRKRIFAKVFGYFMIATGVYLFSGLIFFELTLIRKFFYFVFGLNAVFSGFDQIRGRKQRFISIDEEKIECLAYVNGNTIASVDWTDIRWVKYEKSGGITIYRDSSFSNHFSLPGFSEEDTKEICRLFTEQALTRNIRLINFSEPVSAVA